MILVFGLLAAFIPGLAYVTVLSDFSRIPYNFNVRYFALTLDVHMFTLKLAVCAIGGATGLFSVLRSKISAGYVSFAAIAAIALGLELPAWRDVRTIYIPEIFPFEVPWIGFLLVLVGSLVMFLSLALKNPKVHCLALLSVPLLLISYSTTPIMVLINYFPKIVFGSVFSFGSVLLSTMGLVGQLLMLWGTFKAVKVHA